MHRNLFALVALLAVQAAALEASAACTAGNPDPNVIESTPTSAFTNHGNGTVTHNLTGLMWKQCAQGLSGAGCTTGTATAMNWSGALAAAVADTTAGYGDWRLPNQRELESIVELCGYSPAINQTLFPATPASFFWSGSSYVPNPTNAWHVSFNIGGASATYKTGYFYYVRLVRGGQSLASCDAQSSCSATPTTPLPQPPATPPLDTPTARNLVLVTHGWNSSTDAWPNALVDAICGKLGPTVRSTGSGAANVAGVDHSCKSPGSPNWVVYAYNWSPDATLPLPPGTALRNAQHHGDDFASRLWGLANDGSKSWDVVHLIGHSAGAGFVQNFARKVKRLSQLSGQAVPKIHATFLDAFCPNPDGCSYGVAADSESPAADLAEQYVDTRNVLSSWVPNPAMLNESTLGLTNITLPNSFNFDITALDNKGPLEYGLLVYPMDFHAFPYRYYLKTAGVTPERFNAYTLDSLGFGAKWAPWSQTGDVWSATLANYSGFSKGDRCVMAKTLDLGLGSCNPSFTERWFHLPSNMASQSLQSLECFGGLLNGTVSVGTCPPPGSPSSMSALASTTTPAPGMALLRISLTQPANRIRFDYRFTQTGSGGGLQVFIQDDQMIFVTLQNAGDTTTHTSDWIDISTLTAGDQNLRVVVKPLGADNAGADVSNMQFSYARHDDFPTEASLPAGWVQPIGSNAPWVVTDDAAYTGSFSLKSGAISDNQKSELSYTANFSSGNVSFARKVSSELNFDFLEFYIDGVLQNGWSGELDWAVVSFPVAAGTHTLLWRYRKDGSASSGSDAAWIDSVLLPGGGGTNYTLRVAKSGTGFGTVTSNPAGLACGATCSAGYASGASVSLTATPAAGSTFTGWSGPCTGMGTCALTMNAAKNVTATFAPNTVPLRIDIDGSGNYDALTDGLLIIRYLFGLTGSSLTSGALGAGAPPTTPAAIAQHMDNIRPLLDVDGNGQSDALTDGLLIMRYLSGLRGSTLITGAVDPLATRKTATEIERYIQSLGPSTSTGLTPGNCSITAVPFSSAQGPISAGTQVQLTALCTTGETPITYGWNIGVTTPVVTVAPNAVTIYTVTPSNASGTGPTFSTTVYIATGTAPSYCVISQSPNTAAAPVPAGTNVTLTATCASGSPVTSCAWSNNVPATTSCSVNITAPPTSTTYSVTASNSAGPAPTVSTTIYVQAQSPAQNFCTGADQIINVPWPAAGQGTVSTSGFANQIVAFRLVIPITFTPPLDITHLGYVQMMQVSGSAATERDASVSFNACDFQSGQFLLYGIGGTTPGFNFTVANPSGYSVVGANVNFQPGDTVYVNVRNRYSGFPGGGPSCVSATCDLAFTLATPNRY